MSLKRLVVFKNLIKNLRRKKSEYACKQKIKQFFCELIFYPFLFFYKKISFKTLKKYNTTNSN